MVADWFNTVWGWVVSIVGGLSFAGIVTAIIYGCLKGGFAKAIQKINIEEIVKETSEKSVAEGVKRVKSITHKHDIQPLVEEKLKEIAKYTSEEQTKELKKLHEDHQKLVKILEGIASLYDDSFYVSDEVKANLKKSIAEAKNDEINVEPAESEVIDEIVYDEPNIENNPQNESHNANSIER